MKIVLKSACAIVLALSLVALPTFAADKGAKLTPAEMSAENKAPEVPAEAKPVSSAEATVKAVCSACHGADGNSAIALNPKLAGQHPEYLLKQLTNFKEGKRANVVMGGMVANLTPEDMKGLAAYFAG